jgi:hypothetical protein
VLEILSYAWLVKLPYYDPDFWKKFPRARAHEFARFVALAKKGKPHVIPGGRPAGPGTPQLTRAQQKFDLEHGIRYCKNVLGLGLKD